MGEIIRPACGGRWKELRAGLCVCVYQVVMVVVVILTLHSVSWSSSSHRVCPVYKTGTRYFPVFCLIDVVRYIRFSTWLIRNPLLSCISLRRFTCLGSRYLAMFLCYDTLFCVWRLFREVHYLVFWFEALRVLVSCIVICYGYLSVFHAVLSRVRGFIIAIFLVSSGPSLCLFVFVCVSVCLHAGFWVFVCHFVCFRLC